MIVATKKFILACVLLSCANKIHASPKTKFSFRKTFLTPKDYEKRNEELDKCEILERSNFSSDEVEDKEDSVVQPKKDVPNVVANAQIHVRFGEDADPPPTARNEVFIEMPGKVLDRQEWFFQPTKWRGGCPNQFGPHPSSSCQHYPPVFPPYNPYYSFGFPMGFPYYPYHHNSCPHGNQPCACGSSEPKPHSNVTEAPFVYFFTRDESGEIPSVEEIKHQPPELLKLEHLRLIKELLDIGESIEDDSEKGWVFANDSVAVTTPKPTTIIWANTTNHSNSSTTKVQPTTRCPNTNQCSCLEKPSPCNCGVVEEVVLTKVEQPPSCKNKSQDCLSLSENVKFIQINFTDIVDSACNGSCLNKNKTCGPIHDVDDLIGIKENPICTSDQIPPPPCQQTFPYAPYGDPRYANFNPWTYWGHGPPAQPPFLPPSGFYGT